VLGSDRASKNAIGRTHESGADLMSQPTLSRLETCLDWRALARIGVGQMQPPGRIVLTSTTRTIPRTASRSSRS
jgi:hypothetical protein